jgi:hypothetical protein
MSDVSIIRNTLRFESHFTQIPNQWLRDNRIGFRAKGVLAYLLSHKSGWQTSLSHLAEVGHDGKDAIRSAIIELENAGYIIRRRLRNGGQLAGAEWELIDPFDNEPMSETPMLENPMQENPMQENPTVKNTNINKTNSLEKQLEEISFDDKFESFWKSYPRKTAKGSARSAYAKALHKIDWRMLGVACDKYACDPNLPEAQFIPHASTWLNQERWLDGALPNRQKPTSSSDNAKAILQSALELEQTINGRREIGH